MGLILDTSVLVHAERVKLPLAEVLPDLIRMFNEPFLALSVLTLTELAQGLAGAHAEIARAKRLRFIYEANGALNVYPVDADLAIQIGEMNGHLRSKGSIFGLADLIIGMTALRHGHAVLTHNVKHFRQIPKLVVVQAPVWS